MYIVYIYISRYLYYWIHRWGWKINTNPVINQLQFGCSYCILSESSSSMMYCYIHVYVIFTPHSHSALRLFPSNFSKRKFISIDNCSRKQVDLNNVSRYVTTTYILIISPLARSGSLTHSSLQSFLKNLVLSPRFSIFARTRLSLFPLSPAPPPPPPPSVPSPAVAPIRRPSWVRHRRTMRRRTSRYGRWRSWSSASRPPAETGHPWFLWLSVRCMPLCQLFPATFRWTKCLSAPSPEGSGISSSQDVGGRICMLQTRIFTGPPGTWFWLYISKKIGHGIQHQVTCQPLVRPVRYYLDATAPQAVH